jgi:transcriptional regulator with XRE-family HTH domain
MNDISDKESLFDINKLALHLFDKRRIFKNLSLRDAANQIGVSYATLSRVENKKIPDIETFAKICVWLDKPVQDYFRIKEIKQP